MATDIKAITIYGLPHALAAAAVAGELYTPIILLSAPAAGSSAGPAWFQSVITQTREEYPETGIEAILDCAEFNGHALASLRQGLKTIIYNGSANEAIDDIAAQLNATVLRHRPESLDARLAETSGHLEDALRNWLKNRNTVISAKAGKQKVTPN
jgi:hypothetical protein